jgi:hypothetical protein
MILLGDDSNKSIAAKHGVEHYPITAYTQAIPYYHYSSNGESYEKFCFERWFIVRNFAKAHGISSVVYSDSDNAFFTDISVFTYTNARIGAPANVVVPNVLFITTDYLDQICAFYQELYALPRTQFAARIDPYGHAYSATTLHYADMMFLQQAIHELKLEFVTLPEREGDIIFNANIQNYEVEKAGSIILKKDTRQKVANLHFQGHMKAKIPKYM